MHIGLFWARFCPHELFSHPETERSDFYRILGFIYPGLPRLNFMYLAAVDLGMDGQGAVLVSQIKIGNPTFRHPCW